MPTLKAPRKTATTVVKKTARVVAPKPKLNADKIAKAKAAAAAKKNSGADKPSAPAKPATAATKTAAAVKKAAATKKPRTSTRAKASPAPADTGTTRKLNLFTTAEVAAMNIEAKKGMAAFLEVPSSVYGKLSEADLDSLLLGTHDFWFKD